MSIKDLFDENHERLGWAMAAGSTVLLVTDQLDGWQYIAVLGMVVSLLVGSKRLAGYRAGPTGIEYKETGDDQ